MKFAVRQTTYTHTIFERKTLCASSKAIRASPPVSPKFEREIFDNEKLLVHSRAPKTFAVLSHGSHLQKEIIMHVFSTTCKHDHDVAK
jgi:hypothetical protein